MEIEPTTVSLHNLSPLRHDGLIWNNEILLKIFELSIYLSSITTLRSLFSAEKFKLLSGGA